MLERNESSNDQDRAYTMRWCVVSAVIPCHVIEVVVGNPAIAEVARKDDHHAADASRPALGGMVASRGVDNRRAQVSLPDCIPPTVWARISSPVLAPLS